MNINDYYFLLDNFKNFKVSENFTAYELIKSDKALKCEISNIPSTQELINLMILTRKILQPCRSYFNKPLIVLSCYRSKDLNKSIGGATESQHMQGQACDINIDGIERTKLAHYIIDNLNFDQLIYEPSWIHVSFVSTNKNRKQVLKYSNGSYFSV